MATATPVGYAPPMNAPTSSSDVEGVGYLKVGSGLGIAVQTLFWAGFAIFYLIFLALESTSSNIASGAAATIPAWITVNVFFLAVGTIAAGLILGVVSFVFFLLGFRAIKKGAPAFGAPTALMVVGLIGYLLATLGLVVIIGAIASAINAAAAGTVTAGTAAVALSTIFGGLALIGLGGLLGLIGVIGLVLGNWRAGSRYAESMAKVGAILSIVPFVSIVGYVLLLVGYARAGAKLQHGWMPSGYGAPMGMPAYYAPAAVPPPPPGNYWPPAPPQ